MGMYFPREAAAWALGVSVTWLQPCLLSVNLLASWSSSLAIKGWDCCLAWPWALSTGCWVPIPCLPSAPKHLEMLYHPKRAWPQVGCEARNPHRGKAGGAQVTWEGEEWGHPSIAASIPSSPSATALLLSKPSWQQWHFVLQRAPAKHVTAICIMGWNSWVSSDT